MRAQPSPAVCPSTRAPPLVASARLLLVAPLVPPGLCSPRRACPTVRLPRGRDGGMGRAMGSRELARGITLDPAIRKRARSRDLPCGRPASGVQGRWVAESVRARRSSAHLPLFCGSHEPSACPHDPCNESMPHVRAPDSSAGWRAGRGSASRGRACMHSQTQPHTRPLRQTADGGAWAQSGRETSDEYAGYASMWLGAVGSLKNPRCPSRDFKAAFPGCIAVSFCLCRSRVRGGWRGEGDTARTQPHGHSHHRMNMT